MIWIQHSVFACGVSETVGWVYDPMEGVLLKGAIQATASVGSSSNSERQQQGAKRVKVTKASSAVQRQHPGMMSANDRSTAHNGSVTSLQTSDDGLYLFSAGRPVGHFFLVH
jgi:hypothetical protein